MDEKLINKEYTLFFSKNQNIDHIDDLLKIIAELHNSEKDFVITVKIHKINKEDVYLQTK